MFWNVNMMEIYLPFGTSRSDSVGGCDGLGSQARVVALSKGRILRQG